MKKLEMKKFSLALLHHPVLNKRGEIVTSSISNMDIHDISRVSSTYGLDKYFIVNPDPGQLAFAKEMLSFWQEGYGKTYNEDRSHALALIRLVENLDQIKEEYGPYTLVATSAREIEGAVEIEDLASRAKKNPDERFLLLFGTGWGLSDQVFQAADLILKPIKSKTSYNHLSVRSAAAIIIDRLEKVL